MPEYMIADKFMRAVKGISRSDLTKYVTPDGREIVINGERFNRFDLGVDRKLAEIDRFTAAADAFFELRDAMQNPVAKDVLKQALG